ncbi:MAG: OmpA family protein [Acidobacteria bacterium]|nr:OmpA family protein [Acidobacteriota bacterium]
MILKPIAAAGALSLLAATLFAQGLTTNARPTDWEEINFEFNSHILSDGYPSLLRLSELLKEHPDFRVAVVGHTDRIGSNRYNEKLALARANTVRDFLVKYGAAAGQITTSSEGKNNPTASNGSKEGRFMNRRVTLTVTDGQGKVVGDGGVGAAIHGFDEVLKKQDECCSNLLKRLDKLDDILAALRELKGENDKLKGEVADLRNGQTSLQGQVAGLPKPLSEQQTTAIAKAETDRALNETRERNRKFSLRWA